MRNGSIEGIELKCPVLVESRGLRQDSCGAGKYRGGLGIDMQVRNLVEGNWNFEQTAAQQVPALGASRAARPASRAAICSSCRAKRRSR